MLEVTPLPCCLVLRRAQRQALRALVSEKLALECAQQVVQQWLARLADGCPVSELYQFSTLGDGGSAEFYDFSDEGEEGDGW